MLLLGRASETPKEPQSCWQGDRWWHHNLQAEGCSSHLWRTTAVAPLLLGRTHLLPGAEKSLLPHWVDLASSCSGRTLQNQFQNPSFPPWMSSALTRLAVYARKPYDDRPLSFVVAGPTQRIQPHSWVRTLTSRHFSGLLLHTRRARGGSDLIERAAWPILVI